MPEPFEIIAGPIQAYIAPLATAWPDLDEAPAADWILLGESGDDNITEDGLTIRHTRSFEMFNSLGSTLSRKTFGTGEGIEVEFNIADLRAEVYDKALGGPATAVGSVVDTPAGAGVAGEKSLILDRGTTVHTVALLCRCGMSPYGDFNSQWQFPAVQQNSEPELVFTKGVPIALNFRYIVIQDPNGGNVRVRFQTAAPTS